MPIYDNDGTTSHEIGQLYDNNGSANAQIGKVYDNNGTANSLIYEDAVKFYPGYSVQGAQSSGSYGSFYANSSNSNGGWGRAYITVNLTGISKLKITYTYSSQTYTYLFIGVCTNWNEVPSLMKQYGYIKSSAVLKIDNTTKSATNATATLDVSGLSGNHYVGIQAYSGSVVESAVSGSISAIESA